MATYRLGIDIGGTFTDIVLLQDDGSVLEAKVPSTPQDYSIGIMEGVAALLAHEQVVASSIEEVVHGTTVATNTIIERTGAKTALLTTRGFRDVLELGRYRVPRLYDLNWRKPEPLVSRELRYEVRERLTAAGDVYIPLDEAEVAQIADRLRTLDIRSIAVCLLHSHRNPVHEQRVRDLVAARFPAATVTISSEVSPQIQEYERTSTTVVNAYIRPVMERYIRRFVQQMRRSGVAAPVQVMQSSGGVVPVDVAARNPAFAIESGPAGGVVGAQKLVNEHGLGDLVVFDMGGTTAKASIIENGALALAMEQEVGGAATLGHRLIRGAGYMVQAPTVDIAEVGAGGGSIAWLDGAGGLRVGPRSAGAEPGPVCYDRGGALPTVTDANLLLGYLNPGYLVGGRIRLNFEKARGAVEQFGRSLGLETVDAAYGIHALADASMERAIKGVTVERGRDPASYALFAIGGNGGVHGSGLAEFFGIPRVIVPPAAGLFSALGMLLAEVEYSRTQGFYGKLRDLDPAELAGAVRALADPLGRRLAEDGFEGPARQQLTAFCALKYDGQIETLLVGLPEPPRGSEAIEALAQRFHAAHERNYGYASPEEPLSIVSLKVVARGLSDRPRVPRRLQRIDGVAPETPPRRAYFGPELGWADCPVVARSALSARTRGPLVVEELDCTTVVRPGWDARLDDFGYIVLERAR